MAYLSSQNSKISPHNKQSPVNLRDHPVCYLCGGGWILVPDEHLVYKEEKVVMCGSCEFATCVVLDAEVFEARRWCNGG
jgi:hypothetical protein